MNETKTININGYPYLPTSYLLLQLSTSEDLSGLELIHLALNSKLLPELIKPIQINDIHVPEWRLPYERSLIQPLALPVTTAMQAGMVLAKEALDNRYLAPVGQPRALTLMSEIPYEGRIYRTSKYFYESYKENLGSKYTQLSDFNRLIRAIETYDELTESGDIVELIYSEIKESRKAELASLLKSNSYNQITLLSRVGQKAISHHLDDLFSKQLSVAINKGEQQFVATNLPATQSRLEADITLATLLLSRGVDRNLVFSKLAVEHNVSSSLLELLP